MAYQPIENYGIIGDMHSVALVGINGSIDWFCFPHFDSPSVFGRILDARKGGYFQIASTKDAHQKQLYWPATNVLITRFLNPDGVGEVTDYMPVGAARERDGYHGIIRRVSVVRGSLSFRVECQPAFDFVREPHRMDDVRRGLDGLTGDEGTFNICSFWLVEALTRAGQKDRRRLEEARLMFEKMLTYANHLGLYSEETGPSGEALGNFPQAFTHLALISAAFNLDRALSGRK